MDVAERAAIALEEVCGSLPGGGERRSNQETMTRQVAESIDNGCHLIVQAGTGTGKSLAYLVPAILSGQTTVVATATKALQDQLFNRDLPFLAENLAPHLGREITFSLLKGRSNYVCRQRLEEITARDSNPLSGQGQFDGLVDKANANDLATIVKWAEKTTTGDRSDLDNEPSAETWASVSVNSQECPGVSLCPKGEECFAQKARDDAENADVIVTNLHLYGIDVATDGAILPPHEIVVLDEAHQTEDVLARASGFELRSGRLRVLAARSKAILGESSTVTAVSALARRMDDVLKPNIDQRVVPAESETLSTLLELAQTRLEALRTELLTIPADQSTTNGARRTRALKALETLGSDITASLDLNGGPLPGPQVAWVEGSHDYPFLQVAPVDVAEILSENLWTRRTVILTSATVPVNLAERLGLASKARNSNDLNREPPSSVLPYRIEDVGTPFDFENQCLLYCATSMPDPRDSSFLDACHEEIERLATAAGGRMLALFTSRHALDAAVESLRDRLPWTVLHQDDFPKPRLIARFAEEETSCLFATRGLWHGIDVPGPSLSLVVIDRIPFPRPDDPLLSARRELVDAESAFRQIDLPVAATELAQGAGRLIRSRFDRGMIAVLDRRLATSRSYGSDLIQAFPEMPKTGKIDEALDFLARLGD